MGFNDGLDQAQSKTQTSLRPAFVAAIKPHPYFSALFRWNADAGVAETHDNAARLVMARRR